LATQASGLPPEFPDYLRIEAFDADGQVLVSGPLRDVDHECAVLVGEDD